MKSTTKLNTKIIVAGFVFIALAFAGIQYMSIGPDMKSDIFTVSEISGDGFLVEGYSPSIGKFEYYVDCAAVKPPSESCVATQIYDVDGNYVDGSVVGCLMGSLFNHPESFENEVMKYLIVIDQGKNEPPINVKLMARYNEYTSGWKINWYVYQFENEILTDSCTGTARDMSGYGVTYVTHSDKEKFILQLTDRGDLRIQFIEPYASRTYCGNAVCDGTETWQNCPEDCATEEIIRLGDDLARQIEIIDEMEATLAQKAEYITLLTSNLNEQIAIINVMELDVVEKQLLIAELTNNLNEQATIINSMEVSIAAKAVIIQELTTTTSEQAQIINELDINLQEKVQLISQLTATNEEQTNLINQMQLSFSEQKAIIDALDLTIAEDAALISQLELSESEKALLIQELSTSLEEEMEYVRNLEVKVSEQGVIIANLNLVLEDEYVLIDSLNLKIEEQAILIANLRLTIEEEQALIELLTGGDSTLEQRLIDLLNEQKALKNQIILERFVMGGAIALLLIMLLYMVLVKRK